MAQLKAYLSEVPAERFKIPMKVADIPRLFTPETFCKLVVQAQRDAKAGGVSNPFLQETPRRREVLFSASLRLFVRLEDLGDVGSFRRFLVCRPHHGARTGVAGARYVRHSAARRCVSVMPHGGSRRAVGGMGRDGAYRIPRPAGRGACARDAVPARGAARAAARPRRRNRELRRRGRRLRRHGRHRWSARSN